MNIFIVWPQSSIECSNICRGTRRHSKTEISQRQLSTNEWVEKGTFHCCHVRRDNTSAVQILLLKSVSRGAQTHVRFLLMTELVTCSIFDIRVTSRKNMFSFVLNYGLPCKYRTNENINGFGKIMWYVWM